jgi:DUF2934 family protein
MPKTSMKVAMRGAPRSAANDTAREQSDEIIAKSQVDMPQQESRMNRIARRAHEIYEARGGNHGKALEDWLQAEREIDDAMGDTEG